ncbi:hypothetical protein TNCV_203071 [Trichonephila clavipes]|nr:hypothetical protein TNCV_203071 [Trichonephila clavipes]
MVLKANDRRTSSPCHDEFRGPRSDYCVRQVASENNNNNAAEVINRLENQRHVFGNPARIITDKGSAFTSSAFEDYCKKAKHPSYLHYNWSPKDLMGQIENKIPPSLLKCCQNFLSTILRNGTLTYPTCKKS